MVRRLRVSGVKVRDVVGYTKAGVSQYEDMIMLKQNMVSPVDARDYSKASIKRISDMTHLKVNGVTGVGGFRGWW